MRPLTFTSPAFQSAVSIKDGCTSYVFPIHQRPRDARPHTDGQLDMMEGERVRIREGRGWKCREMKKEENEKIRVTKVECSWKYSHGQRMATEKRSQVHTTMGEEEFCAKSWSSILSRWICFVQGGLLPLRRHSLKCYRNVVTLHNRQNTHNLPNNILQEAVKSKQAINKKGLRENRWSLHSLWQSVGGVCGSGRCPALFRLK